MFIINVKEHLRSSLGMSFNTCFNNPNLISQSLSCFQHMKQTAVLKFVSFCLRTTFHMARTSSIYTFGIRVSPGTTKLLNQKNISASCGCYISTSGLRSINLPETKRSAIKRHWYTHGNYLYPKSFNVLIPLMHHGGFSFWILLEKYHHIIIQLLSSCS